MIVDVLDTRCFCQSILLTVDVLGQKIDVFVIDVLKIDVLEIVQMGRPEINDSKIIAIDYYSHERNCLNGLQNIYKLVEMLVMLEKSDQP